jgi:hypothetical protein
LAVINKGNRITMKPGRAKGPAANRLHHDGSGKSQDRKRDHEEQRHHPEAVAGPHPAHKARKHPVGNKPQHEPHRKPEEYPLNIDHGIHEDRPRPGKLTKKGRYP